MDIIATAHGQPPMRSLVPIVRTARARALTQLAKADSLALLLGRLAIGLLFLSTGWGKVNDLARVTEFFTSLHIPFPGFHAVLVGYSELLCGAAITTGLLTRLATLPLIVSMFVAILTARLDDVQGLFDLIGLEEFTYMVLLTMLLILGPGRASVDRWLERKLAA
ncbi:MAG TPA: DoxX family protein [Polyangiales bacterium]